LSIKTTNEKKNNILITKHGINQLRHYYRVVKTKKERKNNNKFIYTYLFCSWKIQTRLVFQTGLVPQPNLERQFLLQTWNITLLACCSHPKYFYRYGILLYLPSVHSLRNIIFRKFGTLMKATFGALDWAL
jgi:hypothetical protein